jgi:hypothetical protein
MYSLGRSTRQSRAILHGILSGSIFGDTQSSATVFGTTTVWGDALINKLITKKDKDSTLGFGFGFGVAEKKSVGGCSQTVSQFVWNRICGLAEKKERDIVYCSRLVWFGIGFVGG